MMSWSRTIALALGVIIVYLILGYFRPVPAYNAYVAETIFLVASVLVLWVTLSGRMGISLRTSGSGWALAGLLIALTGLSTLGADDPAAAWNRLKLYYVCAMLGVGLLLVWQRDATGALISWLLSVALIHAGFLVELMTSIYAWEGRQNIPQKVGTNYFSHIRHFGYLGFFAACASTALILLSRHLRLVAFVLGVLALYGLIQFGSRGAFLAWLLFLAALVVVLPGRRSLVVWSLAMVAIASAAVVYVDSAHPFPNKKQQSVFTRNAVGEDQWGTTRGRIGIWQDSWREITKRPWLGHGPDAYVLGRCCLKGSVQPHNVMVQSLFEFGGLGTLGLLTGLGLFMVRPLRRLLSQRRAAQPDSALAVLVSMTLSLLAFSFVDGLLYHAIPLLHVTIVMALLGAIAYRPDTAEYRR